MLTRADFHQNWHIISIGCKMGIFPVEVNFQRGELQLLRSKRKQAVTNVLITLYAFHALYVTLRLPYLLLKGNPMTFLSLLIHVTMIAGMVVIGFSHYTAFFQWPDVTVTCFNKAFDTWELEPTGEFELQNIHKLNCIKV